MKVCRKNKGVIIVLVAGILVPVILLFLVVGGDFAYMYYVRGELQNAADSAALAGAAKLDNTGTVQTDARKAAWQFACKNKAAHEGVFLVSDFGRDHSNPDCDNSLPTSGLNESANNPDGDIVVGNWNPNLTPNFDSTRTPVNAVKVVARRTGDVAQSGVKIGNNPVSLLFGKLVKWPFMGVKREAIAVWELLGTPALSVCVNSCTMTGLPGLLDIGNVPDGADNGIAWTVFRSVSPIQTSDVDDLIDGTRKLTPEDILDLCTTHPCITTKNGASESLNYLGTKFRDPNFDAGNKKIESGVVKAWTVGIVITDYHCCPGGDCSSCCPDPSVCSGSKPCSCGPNDCNQGCPPSASGSNEEPYHIKRWARVSIIQVCDNTDNTGICHGGNKGVVISELSCVSCDENPFDVLKSDKPKLVK